MLPGLSKVGRRHWATTTTIWLIRRAESFCRSMRRRHCSVKKRWRRGACLSMLVSSEFTHRIWQWIRHMEVESFWRGSWHVTFSRTSRLSIAVTRPRDTLHESSSVTSLRKMRATVRKGNHCTIEVRGAAVRVISIARRKRNAKGVRRRTHVPEVPIGDCLFIGTSQRDKQFVRWQVPLITSAPNGSVTRLKLCSPNSSNRSNCVRYDCDDCGTSLSSSTSRQRLKT